MKIIDIHIHGIGGFDTRTASEGNILHIAELHGSHGVSEIILTVYSSTIEVMRENIQTIKDLGIFFIEGNASDKRLLKKIRVDHAKYVISTITKLFFILLIIFVDEISSKGLCMPLAPVFSVLLNILFLIFIRETI